MSKLVADSLFLGIAGSIFQIYLCTIIKRSMIEVMMQANQKLDGELRVLLNHIYEYKKGVRNMVLCTLNERYRDFAEKRLKAQSISYCIQEISSERFNLYFGRKECLDVVNYLIHKPLNMMTPEEDFIIGTLLGYNVCLECSRYCTQRERMENNQVKRRA